MKQFLIAGLVLSIATMGFARETRSVKSPDGRVVMEVVAHSGAASTPTRPGFVVRFHGRELLAGEFGLSDANGDLFAGAALGVTRTRSADSSYAVLAGKSNPVRDQFNELTLDWQRGRTVSVQLIVRAYNDGVAFRYVIPKRDAVSAMELTDETTSFRLTGDPRVWPLHLENFRTSHEGLYAVTNLAGLATDRLIDVPFVAQYGDGRTVAIAEAGLRNFAGLSLQAEDRAGRRELRCVLSPSLKEPRIKVRAPLPLTSPWRVILLGAQPGRLIESNLILNLNEPSVIENPGWLTPGKTTWYWWNGPYQEPVDFQVGMNWETMKHYIDFCARNGITFHAIMSTPDDFPWYQQSTRGFGPGPDTDVTRPRDGFPMERVAEYAKAKGVGLRLWVHWKPLSKQLEKAFAQYEAWGIRGLMVDFLDRNDQEMVRFAERVLESAARHHLHIHFHGVWAPTGLQRTYPNLFNHEGVLNLEYLKWSDQPDPRHNVTVPFTRMLAGPMDYHLGGFRAVKRADFKPQGMRPVVLGTRAHHLAMYVAYDNPMPMVSDAPTAYEGQQGFEFIRDVPVTWDETRVLDGRIGEYLVTARRSGKTWYLGAMTDWTARTLRLPLNFLPRGKYEIESWADDLSSDDPNRIKVRSQTLDAKDALSLQLKSGGGQALRIRRVAR